MNNRSCDVLVTCGRFSDQIVWSLGRRGLNVGVVDSMKSPIFRSKYVRWSFISPVYQESENDYIDFLVKTVQELKPRVIIPIFDFLLISKHKDLFPSSTIITVESFEKLDFLDNKSAFVKYAQSIGVPVPEMYSSSSDVDSFPVVAKLPKGRSGAGVFFLNDIAEVQRFEQEHLGEDFFLSKYISGKDYCVDCVRYGDYFNCSVYRSVGDSELSKGPLSEREIIRNEAISRYSKRILDSLDYHGVCGFDFRVDDSDNVYLLEANPRFTGGLGAQIAAGFDIPYILYCLFTNNEPPKVDIKYGYRSKSFFTSLSAAYRNIADYVPDYNVRKDIDLRRDHFDDWAKDDKVPFFNMLLKHRKKVFAVLKYYLFSNAR